MRTAPLFLVLICLFLAPVAQAQEVETPVSRCVLSLISGIPNLDASTETRRFGEHLRNSLGDASKLENVLINVAQAELTSREGSYFVSRRVLLPVFGEIFLFREDRADVPLESLGDIVDHLWQAVGSAERTPIQVRLLLQALANIHSQLESKTEFEDPFESYQLHSWANLKQSLFFFSGFYFVDSQAVLSRWSDVERKFIVDSGSHFLRVATGDQGGRTAIVFGTGTQPVAWMIIAKYLPQQWPQISTHLKGSMVLAQGRRHLAFSPVIDMLEWMDFAVPEDMGYSDLIELLDQQVSASDA